MKNNKAVTLGFELIIVIIVTIAFAIIYFLYLQDFRIFGENLSDYTICKNSNIENAKLKLKLINQIIQERSGNRCRTHYLTVPKGKEFEFIAKNMASCWDQYLEGKEELFDTEDNNYCAFCSVLTFEDKKQLKGLTNYLIEKEVTGKKVKYHQYLTNTIVTRDVFKEIENSHLNDLHIIDTSKPLAIIFTMGKNVNPGSLTGQSSIVSGTITSAVGAVGGLPILIGVGVCSGFFICSLGAFAISVGTGAVGYMIGSTNNPDLDTKVLLWPYTNEDLDKLKCTMLEGKDRLDVRKGLSK